MIRLILLNLCLISFSAYSEEIEKEKPKVVIADYRLPPVMVYVDASNDFKSEMINDLRKNLEKNPERCVEYSGYWFCDDSKLKKARGFHGWDGNGEGLMIGFLCENSNGSIPKQKYYSSDLFYRYDCIEVWHPVKNEHVVTYPESEADTDSVQ